MGLQGHHIATEGFIGNGTDIAIDGWHGSNIPFTGFFLSMGIENILSVPGQLCINPTDLDADYPHGGTHLGVIKMVVVRQETIKREITAREFGNEVVDIVYVRENWAVAGVLREWNNNAMAQLFYNTADGSSSGDKVVSYPGTNRGGKLLAQDAVKLCFSPHDLTNHSMLLLYRAIPLVDDAQEINMEWENEAEIAFAFLGVRDGSSPQRIVSWGKKEDLTL